MNRTDSIRYLEAHDLPEGWGETTVGQLAEDISYGFTAKASSSETGPRYLRITDLQNGTVDWGSVPSCRIPKEKIQKYVLRRGDLVFARTGATTGKSFLVRSCPEAIFASYLIRVRPSPCVLPEFLAWFFQTTSYWNQISENIAGSAQPNCNATKLASLNLPIPPLDEQRRIVAKLEELLGKLEACQKRLAKIPVILKRFRQSVLAAACSGSLTADWREHNPDEKAALDAINKKARLRRGVPETVPPSEIVMGWELRQTWGCYSAAELLRFGAISDLKDGNHGANHPKVSDFTAAGLPFITAAQVNNFRIDYEDAYKMSGEPVDRIHVGFAKKGDVIYTHKGSVGRVAIADRDCVLTPQTTYYRVSQEIFANGFLMLYLASPFFSEQADIVKAQTTRDFVPISEQYLLFHRVPPLAEQQEIVRRVEALFKFTDQIEDRYKKAQAQVDKLTQSILAKAFRGELVPTEAELARREGRDYEPASVLLERIGNVRSDSAAAATAAKANRLQKRLLNKAAGRRK